MNTKLKLIAVAAFLALGVSSYAQQAFVRPDIGYSYTTAKANLFTGATNVKIGGAFSYGLDAGAAFGDQNEHELSLSLNIADYSLRQSGTGLVGPGATTDSAKLTVKTIPVMLNYRYLFGAKTDSVRFYLAPSLGYTWVKGRYYSASTSAPPGPFVTTVKNASSSKTDFTLGMGFGAEINLADNVDLDLGYHYTNSQSYQGGPRLNVHTVSAGVSYKF